jgi:transposase-like protein
MSRLHPTTADAEEQPLTPQQEAAADLLALGGTITDVAVKVGVTRQTVSEWLNQNPSFQAAFNRRRQDLWDRASDRLRALVPKALDILESAISEGDAKAALGVLRAAGVYDLKRPEGPTSAEDARSAAKDEERARRERSLMAGIG